MPLYERRVQGGAKKKHRSMEEKRRTSYQRIMERVSFSRGERDFTVTIHFSKKREHQTEMIRRK